jgi:hypothetical protein
MGNGTLDTFIDSSSLLANRQPTRERESVLRRYLRTVVLRQCAEGAVIARCREPFTTKIPAAMWSSHSQLTVNLITTYFRRHYGYEEHDFVKGFQNEHPIYRGDSLGPRTLWEDSISSSTNKIYTGTVSTRT